MEVNCALTIWSGKYVFLLKIQLVLLTNLDKALTDGAENEAPIASKCCMRATVGNAGLQNAMQARWLRSPAPLGIPPITIVGPVAKRRDNPLHATSESGSFAT